LLEHGADPNIPYCPIERPGTTNSIECGTSPLMNAAGTSLERVIALVEGGVEINYKTKSGRTAAIESLLMEKVDIAHYLIVEKKSKVAYPFYYYSLKIDTLLEYDKPHYPIEFLEDWLFPLNSKEHKMKMEIVEEFKKQGQDYWSREKHPETIKRIKKIHPNNWEEYLKKY
jgi:uncharacterized protein